MEHPFIFFHGKLLRVIFSDYYEDNYISPGSARRLSVYPEARSSYFYRDDHCIVQFKIGKFIGSAKYFFDRSLSMDHLLISGKTWLDEKMAKFYNTSNTLQICE